jgi:hypothetical protein
MKRSMRMAIHTHGNDYKCEFHLANEETIITDESVKN